VIAFLIVSGIVFWALALPSAALVITAALRADRQLRQLIAKGKP
jgi:hypothetical protein